MKRILALLAALLLLATCVACSVRRGKNNVDDSEATLDLSACYTKTFGSSSDETDYVLFTMEGGATFVVELYPTMAPVTVKNFKSLVASGFYNGETFHRIIKDFCIWGGLENTPAPVDEKGEPIVHEAIQGEFAANDFPANTLKHTRGVISMMRGTDNNSATTQFFIVHKDSPVLDGKYAAFGRVILGMETVDAIASLPVTAQGLTNEESKPVKEPVISSVTFIEKPDTEEKAKTANASGVSE